MRSFHAPTAVAVLCSFGLGCAATVTHPIHVPPTYAEVYEINSRQWPLYVELLPTSSSGGGELRIKYVVSADAEKIVVARDDGPPFALRVGDVARFQVRPTSSAATGAAVGAGLGVLIGLGFAKLTAGIGAGVRHGVDSPPSSGGQPVSVYITSAAIVGAIGALIGAAVASSPDDVPVTWIPTPDPPLPSSAGQPPTLRTPALVVVPSAEVRSAPFEVAPVIAVLAHGEHLLVGETSREGWRVAFLPQGRVGYIQDAQVRGGAP